MDTMLPILWQLPNKPETRKRHGEAPAETNMISTFIHAKYGVKPEFIIGAQPRRIAGERVWVIVVDESASVPFSFNEPGEESVVPADPSAADLPVLWQFPNKPESRTRFGSAPPPPYNLLVGMPSEFHIIDAQSRTIRGERVWLVVVGFDAELPFPMTGAVGSRRTLKAIMTEAQAIADDLGDNATEDRRRLRRVAKLLADLAYRVNQSNSE